MKLQMVLAIIFTVLFGELETVLCTDCSGELHVRKYVEFELHLDAIKKVYGMVLSLFDGLPFSLYVIVFVNYYLIIF